MNTATPEPACLPQLTRIDAALGSVLVLNAVAENRQESQQVHGLALNRKHLSHRAEFLEVVMLISGTGAHR